ncbi:glycosyltransferase family 9 protein [Pseudodesulfovibrio sediminis]|uniref:Heptosyltransferase n=1 Tax=Pseudodesulfovibrio sediminis TaxID=2810563 RepID=A0ABM7P340_9BACT|nr:glycosyltransferase family 9 protein [Pseudodesulfovibrio sediminis]BCS87187.1 heptosyltransferase [Pseudodesulfovibrio sediminis]
MKNYLVIQLARFGDLIQTKRLVATLTTRPDATVHLCVDISLEPLARLVYPDVIVHPILAHGTGLSGHDAALKMLVENRRSFAELSGIDFETIYNLNFSPLNFRLAALFDHEKVEGYSWHNGQEITGQWPAMAMRWSRLRRLGMNLVDFWAGYCPDMIVPEQVNPHASPKGGGIGVVLAGRESRRSLPASLLATMVTTMSSTVSGKIFLLGGASEHQAGQSLLKALSPSLQSRTENKAGKTDWAELVDLVGSLDMLLTPDTGTMHLAAHLGTPVRAFFLSSAWCFETGPYGLGHTVYQGVTECLPCLETQPCPYDVRCLGGFTAPQLQRFLITGKSDHTPEGILGFKSSFDALGQIYTSFAGEDADLQQRTVLRQFILQHLSGVSAGFSELEHAFAHEFYREKDWMTKIQPNATHG